MRSAMKCQFQSLDMVVRRVLVDPIPHGFSPPMGQQAHFNPPVLEPNMDVEVAPMVPDAQFAPNEQVGDACQTHDVVVDPPHEIPLTQNHPSKCLICMVIGSLPPSLHPFFHSFLSLLLMMQETFLTMWMFPLLLRKCTVEMDSVAPIVLKL